MNKTSDNVELDFPARMNDARQFTDYRANCLINNNVSMKPTSWFFRQDLIRGKCPLDILEVLNEGKEDIYS